MYDTMIPTLRKAVEWAETEAEKPNGQWYQALVYVPADDVQAFRGTSACGSLYCIAGNVVAQHFGVEDPFNAPGASPSVMGLAADLLGLTIDESVDLFRATNNIQQVREIAERIAGERL